MRHWALVLLAMFAAAAGPVPAAPLTATERQAILQSVGPLEPTDDAALLTAAGQYARRELGQRIRPRQVDPLWTIEPARRDVAAELATARSRGQLAGWLAGVSPPFAEYRRLQAVRLKYAQIVAAGGWSRLDDGPVLRQGHQGPAVARLRERLAAEAFIAPRGGDSFDAEVRSAVERFQQTHALEADGVLGPGTRKALNVTAEERLAQIEANLERWRWLPHRLPKDRLEVDSGGAEAVLIRDARPVLAMRVIVGDPRHPTPMFASRIEAAVFNPPWTVPSSIAKNEILPRLRRDPDYLARNGFSNVNGQLVQRPGPKNALGVVKFDLPSPFGVYLHDTPSKSLFARTTRTLSHGCMRLEKPRELAAALLQPQGGGLQTVDERIGSRLTARVALNSPLPLYVLHWTVVAEPSGEVLFRPDAYGWDAKLNAALSAAPVAAPQPRTATDCAGS